MKIELDREEIDTILLEWAKAKWPEMNTVTWGAYSTPNKVEFTHEKGLEPDDVLLPPPSSTSSVNDIDSPF